MGLEGVGRLGEEVGQEQKWRYGGRTEGCLGQGPTAMGLQEHPWLGSEGTSQWKGFRKDFL